MAQSSENNIVIKHVSSRGERKEFLLFPWEIYQKDPLWVPPILSESEKVLDPMRGPFFQRGAAECFTAWRGNKLVGTICVAEDRITNQQRCHKDCMFGFFEYIQDRAVFNELLNKAREWATAHHLDSLYGPFNLDYENSYGVLIEGRSRPPVILCGHSPDYYQGFMEDYGFVPARGDNLAFQFDLNQENDALRQLAVSAKRLRSSGRFRVRSADFTRWDNEVDGVWSLINAALAHLPDFIPWQREAMQELFQTFRKIADPDLILFAECQGKVIGFFPGLPNWNEALIHTNGLRYPWDFLKLAWLTRRPSSCLSIKSVLVQPEFWGSGVALLLFDEMLTRARIHGFQWADLSLTSDDNPKTPMLAEKLGARIYKRYRVYRFSLKSD
jgi:GNAT superfamily N-acetyltransferase